jgi:hypothetical protein
LSMAFLRRRSESAPMSPPPPLPPAAIRSGGGAWRGIGGDGNGDAWAADRLPILLGVHFFFYN